MNRLVTPEAERVSSGCIALLSVRDQVQHIHTLVCGARLKKRAYRRILRSTCPTSLPRPAAVLG